MHGQKQTQEEKRNVLDTHIQSHTGTGTHIPHHINVLQTIFTFHVKHHAHMKVSIYSCHHRRPYTLELSPFIYWYKKEIDRYARIKKIGNFFALANTVFSAFLTFGLYVMSLFVFLQF